MRIHQYLLCSYSNGPGARFVLWLQGCNLDCPGCFNPDSHPFNTGVSFSVEKIIGIIAEHKAEIEGITISGGEPLLQLDELINLIIHLRQINLSIILFSGLTWEEIQNLPRKEILLSNIDVLIAGRYQQNKKIALGLIGSKNKTVHFLSPRYNLADLSLIPEAEAVITPQGDVFFTGIAPL